MAPLAIDLSCMQDHYTKYVSHIEFTYIPKADGPPGQSTIATCKTITPHKFDT